MRTFHGIDEMRAAAGDHLGHSAWVLIDQDQITRFADVTGDHQWVHVDIERARKSQFGATIAHGFLTLSLLPLLMRQTYSVEDIRLGINYGLNKVRFPAPTPVGSRVRANVLLADVKPVSGDGVQAEFVTTIELEGSDKPSCVAESLVRYYR